MGNAAQEMSGEVLGIFMKAPVPGKCKTRLCPPLDKNEAAFLYRAFCEDVLAAAEKTAKDVRVIYDPSPDYPTPEWTGSNHRFSRQNGDGLGERLKNSFGELFSAGHSRVVIIGSDLPTLTPDLIIRAFNLLNEKEAVFGPATDGGYYLVGLSKLTPKVFDGIPWSTDQVMNVTRRRLEQLNIPAGYLPAESDIDTHEDLLHLTEKLKNAPVTLAPATSIAISQLNHLTR